MWFIVAGVALVALAVGLVLYALKNNVSLYFTPTQVFNKEAPQARSFRIGGLVEVGSLQREKDGLTARFNITDTHKTMPVIYKGILPDLFKEGKGVVAQGKLEPMTCSMPKKCWPSMMRTTCRRKPSMRSRRRKPPKPQRHSRAAVQPHNIP